MSLELTIDRLADWRIRLHRALQEGGNPDLVARCRRERWRALGRAMKASHALIRRRERALERSGSLGRSWKRERVDSARLQFERLTDDSWASREAWGLDLSVERSGGTR